MLHFEKSSNMPQFWQKMKKCHVQLALNPFLHRTSQARNLVSGSRSITNYLHRYARYAKEGMVLKGASRSIMSLWYTWLSCELFLSKEFWILAISEINWRFLFHNNTITVEESLSDRWNLCTQSPPFWRFHELFGVIWRLTSVYHYLCSICEKVVKMSSLPPPEEVRKWPYKGL